ncbi:MAG: hypothetical protein N2V77_00385 [Canidatus Methanoxibalbensis ujae]|nr:hypothetical protein [Candidatus Methanoxibalbensis ujae]
MKSFCDVARWRELEGWSGMCGAVVRLVRLNRDMEDGTQEGDGWGDIGKGKEVF